MASFTELDALGPCARYARYGRVCPGTTVDVVRCRGTGHSERTHVKLREEASLRRGKCRDQYMRNLYCLARELAFLVKR